MLGISAGPTVQPRSSSPGRRSSGLAILRRLLENLLISIEGKTVEGPLDPAHDSFRGYQLIEVRLEVEILEESASAAGSVKEKTVHWPLR